MLACLIQFQLLHVYCFGTVFIWTLLLTEYISLLHLSYSHSFLWHYWLSDNKCIQPVKNLALAIFSGSLEDLLGPGLTLKKIGEVNKNW